MELFQVARRPLALKLVRAVATSCATTSSPGFYFVSASYRGRSLISAASELASTVREALGPDRPPHLITLFATPHAEWGAGLADTPQYVRALLTYEHAEPPVVLGGVLRSVADGAQQQSREGEPCVALLAAHLPGVKLLPFVTSQGSLPALPGGGWAEVVRATRAIASAREAAAAAAAAAPAPAAGSGSGTPPGTASAADPCGAVAGAACSLPQFAAREAVDEVRRCEAASEGAAGGRDSAGADPSGRQRLQHPPGSHQHPAPSPEGPQHPQHQAAAPHGQGLDTRQGNERGIGDLSTAERGGAATATATAARTAAGTPGGAQRPGPLSGVPSDPFVAASSSVAALLLSTPHFIEVEELLKRFGQVAPGMQVIGGVTAPGAWGESESNWGAVWLNDRTFAQGAVGCVLQGPFKLDTVVSPGFRGAGPVMRVTQAQGQFVLELDGEPVQRPLQRAISEALNSGEFATSLKIGLGDPASAAALDVSASGPSGSGSGCSAAQRSASAASTSPSSAGSQEGGRSRPPAVFPSQNAHHPPPASATGPPSANTPHSTSPPPLPSSPPQPHAAARQLVTRNWFFQQGPPRPFMTVQSASPIANGTPIQVHLQNYPAAHRHMRDRLRDYAQRLPAGVTSAQGAVGSLALSCSALPFFEGPDVARCLPRAAFVGGKVEGEFCSTVEGQPSRLHSFASCVAFLRAATGS